MRIVLTNLSNKRFEESRGRLNDSANKFGIREIFSYDFDDLKDTTFYKNNIKILSQERGSGYWLWKPYIILESLDKVKDGDIVIYSDCGIEIISEVSPLIKICSESEDILLFGNCNAVNATWTKRDCFVLMKCDTEYCWYGPHVDASFCLFKKNIKSVNFVKEWFKYSCDQNILTDSPNICGLPNLPSYAEHRHDQSILSLLAQRYMISLYRIPSQHGNHYKMQHLRVKGEFNCLNQSDFTPLSYYYVIPYYNSDYFQILNHHRNIDKLIHQPLIRELPKQGSFYRLLFMKLYNKILFLIKKKRFR
jgi:hypothetical protein